MQANTVGDQYSWILTGSDGVTPFPISTVSVAFVAIAGPFATNALALAAGAASGLEFPVTLNSATSTASWLTTVAGINGASKTMYPMGGYYCHQIQLDFNNGAISKSRLFVLDINDSIV